ncbi:MAG: glutaredoxin domain-containing protein [Candidatus Diapherotrites archaeon]
MIELYQLEECGYCKRVRAKLTEIGIEYIIRNVSGDKERRDEVEEISGQRLVPVLVDKERGLVLPDSEKIVEYLEKNYG